MYIKEESFISKVFWTWVNLQEIFIEWVFFAWGLTLENLQTNLLVQEIHLSMIKGFFLFIYEKDQFIKIKGWKQPRLRVRLIASIRSVFSEIIFFKSVFKTIIYKMHLKKILQLIL